jgi:putative transposase
MASVTSTLAEPRAGTTPRSVPTCVISSRPCRARKLDLRAVTCGAVRGRAADGSNDPGQARNLLTDLDHHADHLQFLLRDRDTKFTAAFDTVFTAAGIEVLHTAPQAPRANAHAERWVGTVRRECTDRILIANERHLITVLREYTTHHNGHRPHRTLAQRPPNPPSASNPPGATKIQRRRILGGLINECAQAA